MVLKWPVEAGADTGPRLGRRVPRKNIGATPVMSATNTRIPPPRTGADA